MKRLLIILVSVGMSLVALAHSHDSIPLSRKNVVKFLPVNLPFQSISFEYERMISAKNSVTLGVGLPNQKSIIGKYGIEEGSNLKSAEFGTMHIRTAFRHYTGKKKLPAGFYLEPYLKYQKIDGNGSILFGDESDGITGDVDLKLNSFNVGIQLGAQFLIAKRVSLDLYFLGLEGGFLSGDITATSDLIEEIETVESDMNDFIADLPTFIGDKLEVKKTGKQVNVNASSIPYPWLRGGFCIGIAF